MLRESILDPLFVKHFPYQRVYDIVSFFEMSPVIYKFPHILIVRIHEGVPRRPVVVESVTQYILH